ncbi:conserved Plasmodium protein, unknown function [Plasmodium sp. gorilla clade G3]|nr:conserved Plasmodium protein, unknown function [Plasmodium sp. gorilla clade G3]
MIFHVRNDSSPSNNEKKQKAIIKKYKHVHYDYKEKDEINYNVFNNITKYCCNRNICDSLLINDELINWEKEDKSIIKKKKNYDNTFEIKFQDNNKSNIFTNNLIQKNNVDYNYSKEPLNLTSPLRGKDHDIFISSKDIDKSKNPICTCESKIKSNKKILAFYNECPIINNTFISFDEDTLMKKDIHINNKRQKEINGYPVSKSIYYDESNNFYMYHSNNKGNHPNEDINKENILLKNEMDEDILNRSNTNNEKKYIFNNDKGNKYFEIQDRSIFLYTLQNYMPMESKQDIGSNLILYKQDTGLSAAEKNNDEYIPRYSSNNIYENDENILSMTSKKNNSYYINDISLYDQLITHNNQSNVLYSKNSIIVSKEDIDKINFSYISLMDIKPNEHSTKINISSKKLKEKKKKKEFKNNNKMHKKNKKKLKYLYKKVRIKTPVNKYYKSKKKLQSIKKKIKTDKMKYHEGKKIYYVTKDCLKEKKKRKKSNEKAKKEVKINNIKNGVKDMFYNACSKKKYKEKLYFYINNKKKENKIKKCNRSRKKNKLHKMRKAVMIPLKVKKDDEKYIRNIISFNSLNNKKNYVSSKYVSNICKNKNFIKRNNNIKKKKKIDNNDNNDNNNNMRLDKAISNIINFTNKGKAIKYRSQSFADITNNHNIECEGNYMICDKNNIKYNRKETLNKGNEHAKTLKDDYINNHRHNSSTNNSCIIKASNKENENVVLQGSKYKDFYMDKNKISVACIGKTDKYNIKGYYCNNNKDLDDTKQELSTNKITSLENRILHDHIVQKDCVYSEAECKKININSMTSVFKKKTYESKNDNEKVYKYIRDNNGTKFHILQSVACLLNQGKEEQNKKNYSIKIKDNFYTIDKNFNNKNNNHNNNKYNNHNNKYNNNNNKYNNNNNNNNNNKYNYRNNINNCNITVNGYLMKENNSFNTKKLKSESSSNVYNYDKIKEHNKRTKRSISYNSCFEKKKFCVNQNRNKGIQKYIMKFKNMTLFKNNILNKDFLFDSSFSSVMNIEREILYILNSILFYSYKLKNRMNILINKKCNNAYFLKIKLYILCLIKLIEKYKLDPHSLCIKKSTNIIRRIIEKIKYDIMNLSKVIIEITTFETCLIKVYTIELMMRSLLLSSSLVLDDERLLKISYYKNGILRSCCSEILNGSLANEDNNNLDDKKTFMERPCRLNKEKKEKIYLLRCTSLKKGYVKKMIFNGISLKDIHTIMYKFDGKFHVIRKKKKNKTYNSNVSNLCILIKKVQKHILALEKKKHSKLDYLKTIIIYIVKLIYIYRINKGNFSYISFSEKKMLQNEIYHIMYNIDELLTWIEKRKYLFKREMVESLYKLRSDLKRNKNVLIHILNKGKIYSKQNISSKVYNDNEKYGKYLKKNIYKNYILYDDCNKNMYVTQDICSLRRGIGVHNTYKSTSDKPHMNEMYIYENYENRKKTNDIYHDKLNIKGKKKKKNYNIDECKTLQQLNECLNVILSNKKYDIYKGVNSYYNKLKEYNEELSLINDLKNEDNHLVKDFLDDMNMYEFSNLLNYYIKRKYVYKTCENNKIRKKKLINDNDSDKSYKHKSGNTEGITQILHDFYLKE